MIKQEDEIDRLEEDIRILKNRYDQFFAGILKLPPLQDRRRLESYIHEFGRKKIRENSRRFRFNTLLSRYNQYRELWGRKMREREEGPLDWRTRQAAMKAAPTPHHATPTPPLPGPPEPAPRRVTSTAADPYVRVSQGTNGEAVRRLYEMVEKEHLKMGRLPPMSVEQLGEMIRRQSESLRARYNTNTVAFRVETKDGKVTLKAKPVQDKR